MSNCILFLFKLINYILLGLVQSPFGDIFLSFSTHICVLCSRINNIYYQQITPQRRKLKLYIRKSRDFLAAKRKLWQV